VHCARSDSAARNGDTHVTLSANLELVRSIYAARERGDYRSTEWAHAEIEFVISGGPSEGSWTGLEAATEAWRDALSAWDDLHPEAEEYRELDDERILVLVRLRGRGKTSGVDLEEMQAKTATLYHVRGGKVTRLVLYADRDRAFDDLGLGSEDDSEPS
jgi:ketosteroid isomerase-like protein